MNILFWHILFWQPPHFTFNPIIFFFSHLFLWLVLLGLVGWFFFQKKHRLLLELITVLITSQLIEIVGKHFSPWVRPFYTNGAMPPDWLVGYSHGSFPSGHGLRSAILLYYLWKEDKKAFWLLLPGVILADVGRVLFSLHYPVDIIGGIVIGIVLIKLQNLVLKKIRKFRK